MVTLDVIAVTPEGKRLKVSVRIGEPERAADGTWSCRVEIAPLQAQALNVRGIDSFHAMWLACSLVLKLLEQLKSGGGRLLNADGSEFPLEAYLSGLDGKPT